MARDVRLDDVGTMIDKLGNWASTTQVLLSTLEVSFIGCTNHLFYLALFSRASFTVQLCISRCIKSGQTAKL